MGLELQTMAKWEKDISEVLREDDVSTIFLVGDTGMGKTWMARKISESAIKDKLCYATLWVSVTKKYNKNLLKQSISRQLCPSSITEELEDEGEIAEQNENNPIFEKMLQAKFKEEKKYLLLVLDGAENKNKANDWQKHVSQVLSDMLPSIDRRNLKLIITVREPNKCQITGQTRLIKSKEDLITEQTRSVEFQCLTLSQEESLNLLSERFGKEVFDTQVYKAIAGQCRGLPAAITLMAEALNYIKQHGSEAWTSESALEEAADYKKATGGVNPLVCCAYDMLQRDVVKNCFWHSIAFFGKSGGVHYNELITHWIIEGYFDPIDYIEEAYKKGHHVLMELIDRGMLKIQEDNIVAVEGAALNMIDCRSQVFGGTANVGLASVFKNGKALGRITQMDGMIKTLCVLRDWKKHSTALLIDGSRLCQEVHEPFFNDMKELEVLAIFNPRIKSLSFSSFQMRQLLVLVLRNCDLLEEITDIKKLENLNALEISGARGLNLIPGELFNGMNRTLRSLNLSGLQIESLPTSFSNLRLLRVLILRGCSSLRELQGLENFGKLQILDLSGASSLSFKQQKDSKLKDTTSKIQTIDLSGTKIQHLQKFLPKRTNSRIKYLTRLLLRSCLDLQILPSLEDLPNLQILDLSGAKNFNHFEDKSIEKLGHLRILNLSKTSIRMLPSIPCNLFELNLSGCSELLELPSTTALKNLELLDVSSTPKLAEIGNNSFEHLTNLRSLNLSNTKVKNLTWLSNLCKLRQLFLKDCLLLETLPEKEGVTKLEVLDLSGCSALVVKGNAPFEHMSRLRELNLDQCDAKCLSDIAAKSLEHMTSLRTLKLSGIATELSSISKLTNLRALSLKSCPGFKVVSSLEALSKLEVLDLSGSTAFESLPLLEKLSNLRELLLSGCSSLQNLPSLNSLPDLKVLDLSKTGIKELPHEMSLRLPDLTIIREVNQCCTFKPAEFPANGKKPSILVNNENFFRRLKEIPELKEAYVKQIPFPVCPPNEQARNGENYCHSDEVKFSNIYFRIKHFPCDDAPFLEIRGFKNSFPAGLKGILKDTKYISLTENIFMKSLSDLYEDNLMQMKGCWLERCPEIISIFCGREDIKLSQNLEILWVSNLPNLKSLNSEKVRSINFQKLTHLHLDCCPKLQNIFTPSQFPGNIEILQIKFCDGLKTLFKENKSNKPMLSKLHTLLLVGLPQLTSIGISMPPLQNLKVMECPMLPPAELLQLKMIDT